MGAKKTSRSKSTSSVVDPDNVSPLEHAIRQFEATEANILKLERIWKEISSLIPSGIVFGGNGTFDERCREFGDIVAHLPAIDGWKLEVEIPGLNEVAQARFDANEVGDFEVLIHVDDWIDEPGRRLADYRFRFNRKRRELVREAILQLIATIDRYLARLSKLHNQRKKQMPVSGADWDALQQAVAEIDTLLGSSMKRPNRWPQLRRHLSFGQVQDLDDIVTLDWPSVRPELTRGIYAENEAIPVEVPDLSQLVAARPKGAVPIKLDWGNLNDEDFERLVFALVTGEEGYENAQWLMKTSAPDRGRDLSVTRVFADSLSGVSRMRVTIQCRHWNERSVGVPEVSSLKDQVMLWEPPRVDVLVIATTGRFTSDAVSLIERLNESDTALRIEMWPESHLEALLATRPGLIAEFRLR